MGKIMRNGVQYGVDTADVLSTVAECDASASGGKGTTQVASAKALSELNSNVNDLKTSFQEAILEPIYDAMVDKGATPASKSLIDIVDGVTTVYNVGYNTGKENAVQGGIPGRVYVALNVKETSSKGVIMKSGSFDATNYSKLYIPIGGRSHSASGLSKRSTTTFNFYNSSGTLITNKTYTSTGAYDKVEYHDFEVDISSISGTITFEFYAGNLTNGDANQASVYSTGIPWLE